MICIHSLDWIRNQMSYSISLRIALELKIQFSNASVYLLFIFVWYHFLFIITKLCDTCIILAQNSTYRRSFFLLFLYCCWLKLRNLIFITHGRWWCICLHTIFRREKLYIRANWTVHIFIILCSIDSIKNSMLQRIL